jgi:ribosomal protein L7/L12
MNVSTRFLAVSALALLGTSAFAIEAEQPSTWMSPSTANRAVVAAEAQAAVNTGSIQTHEGSGTVVAASTGAIKRVQVIAEAREAVRLGLVPTYDGYSREASTVEQEQIRQAGLRAVQTTVAGK